jgi:hypothetical protein
MTEYGTDAWWDEYREFAWESLQRHRDAFERLMYMAPWHLCTYNTTFDLGAGRAGIGFNVVRASHTVHYVSYDADPNAKADHCVDYRTLSRLEPLDSQPSPITMVTSFFSTELTAGPHANQSFYRHLFKCNPELQTIVVAGMYYADKADHPSVTETGGIVSWQSIGPVRTNETRLLIPAPSKMFGETVVEVWRRLDRPEDL